MRWPNCFTSCEEARSAASFPNSTSASPPSAAFLTNMRSEALMVAALCADVALPAVVLDGEVCAAAPSQHRPATASVKLKLRMLLSIWLLLLSNLRISLVFRCTAQQRVGNLPGTIAFGTEKLKYTHAT